MANHPEITPEHEVEPLKISFEQGCKIPRRQCLHLLTPAEVAISEAIGKVDNLSADRRITKAVVLLAEAGKLVSNYVDELLNPRTMARRERPMVIPTVPPSERERLNEGVDKSHRSW